jgi:hypothetical protein
MSQPGSTNRDTGKMPHGSVPLWLVSPRQRVLRQMGQFRAGGQDRRLVIEQTVNL